MTSETYKNVTKITPAMFEAAISAWFRVVRGAETSFLNGTPNPPIPPENLHDALLAALEAALDKLTGEK